MIESRLGRGVFILAPSAARFQAIESVLFSFETAVSLFGLDLECRQHVIRCLVLVVKGLDFRLQSGLLLDQLRELGAFATTHEKALHDSFINAEGDFARAGERLG